MITTENARNMNPDMAPGLMAEATLSLGERITRLRYRWFPDHVVGEILSKRWIDSAAPVSFLLIIVAIFGTMLPDLFAAESFTRSQPIAGSYPGSANDGCWPKAVIPIPETQQKTPPVSQPRGFLL